MNHSERRAALVTGGGQGLGRAIAEALHRNCHDVLIADLDEARARATARGLDASGSSASAVAVDVRSRDDIERAVDATIDRYGAIDVLVNNAGVTPVADFWEITAQEWDDVLAVNLRSVFFGCQLAGVHMRKRGFGRIINLTSIAGQIGSRLAGAHYSASKGGVMTLTKVVAKELASHGVTANALAPAVVRAPPMATLPQDRLQALVETIPVGRIGEPAEVGALAAFLASDDAGYITGATFDVNGGQYMR